MARRRKKHRKTRSRRSNPSHRRKHRSRRSGANPHRRRRSNARRGHGRRARRRNPGASFSMKSFSPVATLKTVAGIAGPVAVGYFGVNLVQTLVKRLFLDAALAQQSPAVQAGADLAVRVFVGVPVAGWLGGVALGSGKRGLVIGGAATNVVVNAGRALVTHVPGVPGWASDLLGDWPGTPGVYGVGAFMEPGRYPQVGVSDFASPAGARGAAGLPSLASGGRGMF
jgi:hypothetical protein